MRVHSPPTLAWCLSSHPIHLAAFFHQQMVQTSHPATHRQGLFVKCNKSYYIYFQKVVDDHFRQDVGEPSWIFNDKDLIIVSLTRIIL